MAGNSPARSWNDPPVLKFDVSTSTGKHHLNKRVFSPLNKQENEQILSADNVQDNKGDVKLLSEIPSSSIIHDKSQQENEQKEDTRPNCDIPASDAETLNYVLSTFKNILQEFPAKSERPLKEIDRRLGMMEKAWDSNLSLEVKHMMYKIAQELSNGNVDSAVKIHCSLMVQNVREVKGWMVGVKHIIEMKKESQDLRNS